MEGLPVEYSVLNWPPSIAMYYYDWLIDSAHGAFGYQILAQTWPNVSTHLEY
jgi:hypothetical protein